MCYLRTIEHLCSQTEKRHQVHLATATTTSIGLLQLGLLLLHNAYPTLTLCDQVCVADTSIIYCLIESECVCVSVSVSVLASMCVCVSVCLCVCVCVSLLYLQACLCLCICLAFVCVFTLFTTVFSGS